MIAIEIESWPFAIRCADNKQMTILTVAIQDCDVATEDHLAKLEAQTLMRAFNQAFDRLARHARERDAFASRWPADKRAQPGKS